MYRGITLFAIEKKILKEDNLDRKGLGFALEGIKIKFDFNSGDLFLNGENIAEKIRLPLVSDHVSSIAALSFIRDFLLKQLRQMGQESGLVMDGRDIGTVVFPEADYKFFFNAQPEVRAQRRFEELKAQGQKITFDAVLENLIQRDALDSDRDVAPLRRAYDAIEIDTSERTTDEVFAFLLQKIEAK
jgi:cytidylate kinase